MPTTSGCPYTQKFVTLLPQSHHFVSYMKFITAFILFVFFNSFSLFSQHIELLVQEGKTSIRGISVVSEKIIWVSGSQGKFAKSLDGGKTWDWETVPKFETRDFRDIEAFDGNTAILMAVSEPAIILKTIDGGKNWKLVFIDSTKGMFLDAMYFANNKSGIVIGDPIDANVFLARTTDQGTTWMRIKSFGTKQMAEGEAFFAASGTNIMMLPGGNQHPVIWASGGRKSRLWHFEQTLTADSLPIIQGKESTGANSLDMYDERHGIDRKSVV